MEKKKAAERERNGSRQHSCLSSSSAYIGRTSMREREDRLGIGIGDFFFSTFFSLFLYFVLVNNVVALKFFSFF